MTDYDLGRATGKIVIKHDERGFRRAEGANDDLRKSAERVAEGYEDAAKAQTAFERQSKRVVQIQDQLDKKNDAAQKALNKLNEAQAYSNRLKEEGKTDTDRYKQSLEAVVKAQNRYNESLTEASRQEKKRNDEVDRGNKLFHDLQKAIYSSGQKGNGTAVKIDTDEVHTKLKKVRADWDATRKLLSSGGGFAAGASKMSVATLGGASLGGLVGLAGSAGAGLGAQGITGVVAAISQMSGALGILPGIIGGVTTVIGTMKVGLDGFSDALESIGTEKFAEALKELAPEAQRTALTISVMKKSFDELKLGVQNTLFEGLSKTIRDLGETYMPIVSQGMRQIAEVANFAAKEFGAFLQQPQTQQDVRDFLLNVRDAFKTLVENMKPALQAFRDIMAVSGSMLPELAQGIGQAFQKFSEFISEMRASGEMQEFFSNGVQAVKLFAGAIVDFAGALKNIGMIGSEFFGDFLEGIGKLASDFKEWTKSVEGQTAIRDFFSATSEAVKALLPVLKAIGGIIFGTIIPAIANLGTGIAPGLQTFFKFVGEGFKILGDALNDPATIAALNQFLSVLGGAFLEVMKELGPIIPKLFQSMTSLIEKLAPVVIMLADAFAEFIDSLSPDDIANIVLVVGSIAALVSIIGPVVGAVSTIAGIVGALGIGLAPLAGIILAVVAAIAVFVGEVYLLRQHFDTIVIAITTAFLNMREAVANGVYDISTSLGEFIGGLMAVVQNVWGWGGELLGALAGTWDTILNFFADMASDAYNSGYNIFDSLRDGMLSMMGPIGEAAKWIMDEISDWIPHSPAKKGPFSGQGYAKVRGRTLARDFAQGIVAGSREAGSAGGYLAQSTESGIERFVKNMTELTSFGQHIANLVSDISDQVFEVMKLATTNPLTGESIFPKRWKRTVSDADLRRKNEDDAFQKELKSRATSGADIADALGMDVGQKHKVDTNGALPVKNDLDRLLVTRLKAAGLSDDQIRGILAMNQVESGGKREGFLGLTNSQAATPEDAIDVFLNQQYLPRSKNGIPGVGDGGKVSDWDAYMAWIRKEIMGQDGVVDWQGNQQPSAADYQNRLMQALGATTIAGSARPGILHDSNGKHSQQAPVAVAEQLSKMFPQLTNIGGARNDSMPYHNEGRALDVMIPGGSTMNGANPEGKALGDQIKSYIMAHAKELGVEDTIWQDFWQPADGSPGHSLGRAGQGPTQGHFDHVHITFANGASADIPMSGPGASRALNTLFGRSSIGIPNESGQAGVSVSGSSDKGLQNDYRLQHPPGLQQSEDTNIHQGTGAEPGIPANSPFNQDSQNLQTIADNTGDSLTQQELMVGQLRGQDPQLDAAIRIAEDANSSDSQVASALDYISGVSDKQRALDTPEGRYTAEGLDSVTNKAAGSRGMTRDGSNPLDTAQSIASGVAGLVSDAFNIASSTLKSIDSAEDIAKTLVRGVENTEDIYKLVDDIQSFIELGASIAKTVSDGLAMAAMVTGAGAAGDPSGTTAAVAAGLGVASSIAGIVSTVFSTINAAIDIGQEAYRIISKYVGQFLSEWVGAGAGALIGDVKFLLDQNTGQLKIWSGDNPQDKRIMDIPKMLQQDITPGGSGIRDLNVYVGPGTDPNEAMNAAMWSIKTDRGGVFTSSDY